MGIRIIGIKISFLQYMYASAMMHISVRGQPNLKDIKFSLEKHAIHMHA